MIFINSFEIPVKIVYFLWPSGKTVGLQDLLLKYKSHNGVSCSRWWQYYVLTLLSFIFVESTFMWFILNLTINSETLQLYHFVSFMSSLLMYINMNEILPIRRKPKTIHQSYIQVDEKDYYHFKLCSRLQYPEKRVHQIRP